MVKGIVIWMLCAVWAGIAVAQTYTAEQHLDMRITGVLLALDTPKRDDIVTVDISVQGQPMLLRLGNSVTSR